MAESDLFLGTAGNFTSIPHESEVESTVYPRWGFQIENGEAEWAPRATVLMSVIYNSPPDPIPAQGTYDVKVITPNGVSDEQFFSM